VKAGAWSASIIAAAVAAPLAAASAPLPLPYAVLRAQPPAVQGVGTFSLLAGDGDQPLPAGTWIAFTPVGAQDIARIALKSSGGLVAHWGMSGTTPVLVLDQPFAGQTSFSISGLSESSQNGVVANLLLPSGESLAPGSQTRAELRGAVSTTWINMQTYSRANLVYFYRWQYAFNAGTTITITALGGQSIADLGISKVYGENGNAPITLAMERFADRIVLTGTDAGVRDWWFYVENLSGAPGSGFRVDLEPAPDQILREDSVTTYQYVFPG